MNKKGIRPVSVVPFEIKNLEDFLPKYDTYPNLHPESKGYDTFWTDRTQECMQGLWGNDSRKTSEYSEKPREGGWRWLPGNVLFYTHHLVIQKESQEDIDQKAKGTSRPDLRDVEWLIGYDLNTCDGFSGYSEDKVYTAFRPVGKMERGEKLSNSDKFLLNRYGDYIHDKYGRYKKYMDARLMLYATHKEPLGLPLWFNESQNYMFLSTRRIGKSYIILGMIAVYNMTFNGAKTLDQFRAQKTSTTTVVGSGNSDKTKEFFAKYTDMYDHLRKNVGSFQEGGKFYSGAWWWKTEGSVLKENSYMTNSVKAEGRGGGQVGPGSRLWHVSYGKSASKGAGTSSNDSIVEEVGLTQNPEDIHAENAPTQKSDFKFGKSTYVGTGGDFELIEGSKRMFFNPGAYEILACKNLFDRGGKDTARFMPATYYENQFRDENGNQNVLLAFEDLMDKRAEKEKQDTKQYLRHKASYPVTHHEIFIKFDGNEFPVTNLENRLTALKNGALDISIGKIAFYDKRNTEGYWLEDFDSTPLMEIEDLFDENINKQGAIVQYEPPVPNRPKRIPGNRNPLYLTFLEPVRNDRGSSFVYVYVWKFYDYQNPEKLQNNIACEWFGRFDNDNEKNLRRAFDMAAYYDSNIFAEVNNDAIVGLARRLKKYDWLQPQLGYIEGLEVSPDTKHPVGAYIAPGQNAGLEKLTNEWLRQNVSFTERIIGGEFIREEVMMADTLNSRMLCSQLIAYNREGNYDAYDGIRMKAMWDKANQKVEEQYAGGEKEKELKDLMMRFMRSRNHGKKKVYR